VIHLIDDRFRDEASRYQLLFACPACAAFDPDGEMCSLEFPNEPHRSESLDRIEITFCKAFELW
jgi:hypothetical protein